jgi:hypothetical protein
MPVNGVVQIAFDRYLLPSTITRQAVVLVDGNGAPLASSLAPRVLYDPVARTVTVARPTEPDVPWLVEGQLYKIQLRIPTGDRDDDGLRAVDRATLEPSQPREIAFFVGPAVPGADPEPRVSFCGDVMPIFFAKCSAGPCHGNTRAGAGLVLSSAAGVAATAIDRVAQGANTGARAGIPEAAGRVFGVDTPIIKRGSPAESWLLYKVEIAGSPAPGSSAAPNVVCTLPDGQIVAPAPPYEPAAPAQTFASDGERAVLSDHVLGREMPYPLPGSTSYSDQPLTFEERERLRLWIQQGASVNDCGCGILDGAGADAGTDAGAVDAGAGDAGDAGDAGTADAAADAGP